MSTTLTESEFHERVDATLSALEDALDDCDADVDVQASGGVLSLTFENGTKLILSRQTPVRQLWLAARSGGFHFDWNGSAWVHDATGEALLSFMSRLALEQGGEKIVF